MIHTYEPKLINSEEVEMRLWDDVSDIYIVGFVNVFSMTYCQMMKAAVDLHSSLLVQLDEYIAKETHTKRSKA